LYDLIIISTSLLVVGLIIGYISAAKRAPSPQAQRKLEEHLQKLEEQQEDYQQQVSEHFSETAQLLNQLTDNYKEVHQHLAKGAQLLCADQQASQQLKQLVEQDDTEQADAANISQPLDYAPKSENKPGVLDESFGLDKKAAREDEQKLENSSH
jgi:uncharacterized membrane-anchored protein YhcB (DUF1043 family)